MKGFFNDVRQAKIICRQTIASDAPAGKDGKIPALPLLPELPKIPFLQSFMDIPTEKFASNVQNRMKNLASNISCVMQELDIVIGLDQSMNLIGF